jgi:hypothetical protein
VLLAAIIYNGDSIPISYLEHLALKGIRKHRGTKDQRDYINNDVLHGWVNYSKTGSFGGQKKMNTKPLTFLLSLSFLFLFGSSSAGEERDLDQDAFICEGDYILVKLQGV